MKIFCPSPWGARWGVEKSSCDAHHDVSNFLRDPWGCSVRNYTARGGVHAPHLAHRSSVISPHHRTDIGRNVTSSNLPTSNSSRCCCHSSEKRLKSRKNSELAKIDVLRFFEIFIFFAHPCLRPPQNLVLFLEAGEGPGKPGSALEGAGGSRGHPWSAPKQNKLKSQKSISVIFRDFHEFCSCPSQSSSLRQDRPAKYGP